MISTTTPSPGQLRLAGISGIIIGTFLIGVALQFASGWIPEYDLEKGTMDHWLEMVSANLTMALIGVGISLVCIILFMPFGITMYRLLPASDVYNLAGISFYSIGTALSLASFTFGFGFTWALTDLMQTPGNHDLTGLANLGMRGAFWADDLATCLLGLGQTMFAISALKAKILPKWLCIWGITGGILVTVILLRYLIPVFAFAAIGYPTITLWWVLTGVNFLRKAKSQEVIAQ